MNYLVKVDITVYHYRDWTILSENFPNVYLVSDFYFSDRFSDTNLEFLTLKGKLEDISKFLSIIMPSKASMEFDFSGKTVGKSNLFLRGNYRNSVRKLISDYGGITKKLVINKGLEKYVLFFIEDDSAEKFIETLSSMALIKHYTKEYIPMKETFDLFFPKVTQTEIDILSFCLKNGFFDTPRKIDMKGLMNNFKVSKSTINYHLRKSIKNILSSYLFND